MHEKGGFDSWAAIVPTVQARVIQQLLGRTGHFAGQVTQQACRPAGEVCYNDCGGSR